MKYDELEICGEAYPIAYPIAAIERLAKELGKDPFAALSHLDQSGDFSAMVTLVRVGLESGGRRAGKPFTMPNDELGELLSVSDFTSVGAILQKYLPAPEPGEPKATTQNV